MRTELEIREKLNDLLKNKKEAIRLLRNPPKNIELEQIKRIEGILKSVEIAYAQLEWVLGEVLPEQKPISKNKGGMDKYLSDLDAYEKSFCCDDCGNDSKDFFIYQRSVANGDVWICKFCKVESLHHKPNEDNY